MAMKPDWFLIGVFALAIVAGLVGYALGGGT